MSIKYHIPVMLKEVIDYLDLKQGKVIVDATIGTGGHSISIADKIMPGGRLIGIDRDPESLSIARERLSDYAGSCDFVYGNFSEIDTILTGLNVESVDGILFDLGISTFQLTDPQRGFSFQSEGPLDMRMDRNSYISAYDLVNNLNEHEISELLKAFGQERWHNRIAHLMVQERQRHTITTTLDLARIVQQAVPRKYRHYQHIHPATRTFQAIRIAVNRELEALESAVNKAAKFLKPSGRICVISFHSLEDRIVKMGFKSLSKNGELKLLTEKPFTTEREEALHNPASRSAKLRAAEKTAVI